MACNEVDLYEAEILLVLDVTSSRSVQAMCLNEMIWTAKVSKSSKHDLKHGQRSSSKYTK